MRRTLITEGHLNGIVDRSGVVTGVAGGGSMCLRWGCGHAEQGGDDEDAHGQGGFDPDGP